MQSEGHSHNTSKDLFQLVLALGGSAYIVLKVLLSSFFQLPNWPTLIIATVIQFWVGFDFYVMAWQALKKGSSNMYTLICLGTTAAYIYSVVVFFFEDQLKQRGIPAQIYFDASIFIITFILVGNYIEALSAERASDAIKKLLQLQPHVARIKEKNGEDRWKEVSVDELALGDIMLVKAGDRIPTDGTIVKGSTAVDESMITGESVPVTKKEGDSVIGATINSTGTIQVEVSKIGEHTMLSAIIRLVEQAQSSRAPIQKVTDKAAAYFVPLVILLALITLVLWFIFGPPPQLGHAIVSMILVLIIACPCALGLATPLSVIISIGRAALRGVLIKNAQAIEQVGSIQAIVLDKTGTLTTGKQTIQDFKVVSDVDNLLKKQGWVVPPDVTGEYFAMALGARLEEQSSHPMAHAYIAFVEKKVPHYRSILKNVALEKSLSIEGIGFEALLNEHTVIIGSFDVMNQRNISVDSSIMNQVNSWFDEGKSVSFLSIDGQLIAYFSIADTIRPEAKQAIAWLKKQDIATIMLTGDNERIAQSVSAQVGVDEFCASVLPDQKVDEIKKLKKQGYSVAMVGDGINDAPALAIADVGIAIGAGTDVAIETAHIILLSNDLLLLPFLFQLSHATMRNIYQNLIWAFGYNILLIPIAMGVLYPFFGIVLHPILAGGAMVFSSLSVVFNSLRLRRINLKDTI